MVQAIFGAVIGYLVISYLTGVPEGDVWTLYRDSISGGFRVHVASFNSDNGMSYNLENCQTAEKLFEQQPGVSVRYWCENGVFEEYP